MKVNTENHEKINSSIPWIVCILFFLLCGGLMIFYPQGALSVTTIAIGIVLMVVGIKNIVVYFMKPVDESLNSLGFGMGLLAVFGGVVMLVNPVHFSALLRYAWAVAILIGSFFKIQVAFSAVRTKADKWWLCFVLAAASLVMGLVAFFVLSAQFDPDVAKPMILFGIFLWVEALMDSFSYFFLVARFNKLRKAAASAANKAMANAAAGKPATAVPNAAGKPATAVPDAAAKSVAENPDASANQKG